MANQTVLNPHLTQLSFSKGTSQKMLWPSLLPVFPVARENFEYYKHDDERSIDRLSKGSSASGGDDKAPVVDFNWAKASAYTKMYHAKSGYTQADLDNAIPGVQMPDEDCLDAVLRRLDLDLEYDAYTNITNDVSASSLAGDAWSDASTGSPIDEVDTWKATLKDQVDTSECRIVCAIGEDVYDRLREHTDIIARVTGGGTSNDPGVINRINLAKVFDVDEIIVGETRYNSAAEGVATPVAAKMWSQHLLLVAVPRTVRRKQVALGYTFTKRSRLLLPGVNYRGERQGVQVNEIVEGDPPKIWVRGEINALPKVVMSGACVRVASVLGG